MKQVNKPVNAVVAVDFERAKERARAIDDQRAKGDHLGPLAGLPMTIKDTFDVEGMPASSGLEVFRRGRRPDAVVVAHARSPGAVIWGKTNTPVMAGDWQTYNGLYGTTNNPWDLERTCGGSSGGAAAALATADDGAGDRLRHRRLAAHSGLVLRRLFAQADLGRGLADRACAAEARRARRTRPQRGRPDGPLGAGPAPAALGDGGRHAGGPHSGPARAEGAAHRPLAEPAGVPARPGGARGARSLRGRAASARRRRDADLEPGRGRRPARGLPHPARRRAGAGPAAGAAGLDAAHARRGQAGAATGRGRRLVGGNDARLHRQPPRLARRRRSEGASSGRRPAASSTAST